ncbi:MAG TPA: DUF4386 domain-containing protein [Nakamurella sp.]
MNSLRKTALVAGGLYLLTFISSIPAVFLLAPVLDNPDYIIGSGNDTRVLLGCLLDLINAFACIGTAVALFPVVKRQNEGVALGFVTSRVMEAAIIVIGVVSLLSIVTLRQNLAGTAGADPAALVTTGQSLVATRDWTFLLGPDLMAGINALLLGSLMYRSRLVPRFIPLMGLVGGPLLITASIAILFGASSLALITAVPVALWEFSLGLYLVVKGFRPSPITPGMTAPAIPTAIVVSKESK